MKYGWKVMEGLMINYKRIRRVYALMAAIMMSFAMTPLAYASEADLKLPDFSAVSMLGIRGDHLLLQGLAVCALGLLFGLIIYSQVKKLPVHRSMKEISELIYATCKTYLLTQGKFILILEVFIGTIMVVYFILQRTGVWPL